METWKILHFLSEEEELESLEKKLLEIFPLFSLNQQTNSFRLGQPS